MPIVTILPNETFCPEGARIEAEWQTMFDGYAAQYPELAAELKRRLAGDLPENWSDTVMDALCAAELAQALNAAGIKFPHACEYNCACATCHVIVKEGFNSLNEPDDDEYDQLDNAFGSTPLSRLSCQTVMGTEDITIEIPKNNRNLVHED